MKSKIISSLLLLMLLYFFFIGMICRLIYDILKFGKLVNLWVVTFLIIIGLAYTVAKYWIFWLMGDNLAKEIKEFDKKIISG